MNLTVIGATGGTGRHVLTQAVTAGHDVTAVVRNPAKLPPTSVHTGGGSTGGVGVRRGELVVITADVMKADELRPAIRGRDAVITTLGPGNLSAEPVVTPALEALVSAMWAENVSRLLLVSNSGMHTDGDPFFLRAVLKPVLQWVLRHHYADAMRAEELLRSTGLDWTIARPPRLTTGPHTGTYRTDRIRNVRGGNTISRADLADFLLTAAADDTTIGQAISLGY